MITWKLDSNSGNALSCYGYVMHWFKTNWDLDIPPIATKELRELGISGLFKLAADNHFHPTNERPQTGDVVVVFKKTDKTFLNIGVIENSKVTACMHRLNVVSMPLESFYNKDTDLYRILRYARPTTI